MVPDINTFGNNVLTCRTETAITASLKKLAVHVYLTLYFAAQCFYLVKDPPISSSSRHEGVSRSRSRSTSKTGESSEDIDTASNVNDPEWDWPIFEMKSGKLVRFKSSKHNTGPFEIIYRNVRDMPWASQVQVSISSPFLIEIIKDIILDTSDRWAKRKKISLDGPELFRISEELRELQHTFAAEREASDDRTCKREKLLHLNHLLRFMDKEFEDMKPMYAAMKSEGRVSWEMLWAFFPPETRVAYIDPLTGEKLCGEIAGTEYGEIRKHGQKLLILYVYVSVYDYNGLTWEKCSRKLEVPKFKEDCQICSLNIYPLQFEKEPDQVKIESAFLEHGKRFCELSMMNPRRFMNYKGSSNMTSERTGCIVKENADGRVMIDLGSFARLNPFFPMGNAQPPSEVIRNKGIKTFDITGDETRMFAPAIVYGFSFSRKRWGSFSVCGFSPVDFHTSAYDDLVMNKTTKDLVENLVRKQLDDGKDMAMPDKGRIDPIASKGDGCVLLCYGPPGTGKTLTAESLSEKLQCPLWCLSVSELGLTPKSLEETLVQVLDVAASWGAILLLDEADLFLEKRKASDMKRTAMTGVFLRQLEYYRGVLFLTTNRDSAFDDAIRSRIAMFLHYEKHNEEQRRKIWTDVFGRVGLKDVPSEDLEQFAKPEFNGREIRNIVKTAHTLSRSNDDNAKLEVDHVRTAFRVYEESSKSWACEKPASEKAPDCA